MEAVKTTTNTTTTTTYTIKSVYIFGLFSLILCQMIIVWFLHWTKTDLTMHQLPNEYIYERNGSHIIELET